MKNCLNDAVMYKLSAVNKTDGTDWCDWWVMICVSWHVSIDTYDTNDERSNCHEDHESVKNAVYLPHSPPKPEAQT